MSLITPLIFFISSLVVIVLIYFKVPILILQQITISLLIILLISSSRFILDRKQLLNLKKVFYYFFIFLFSLFVQLLVIITGGFLSPFLILIHLFALGTSFLLNLKSTVVFLIFTLVLLIVNILVNQNMLQLFQEDPGTTILYVISFIVVVPLAQFLTYNYHFKDTLSRVLKEYIQIGETREESLLGSLNELVFVVDVNLAILSFSASAEKASIQSEDNIIGLPLFDVLDIQNKTGIKLKSSDLNIENMFVDKASRIIKGYYLHTKNGKHPEEIIINMRPIADSQGKIVQIVFIFSNTFVASYLQKHANVEQAIVKRQILLNSVKEALLKTHSKQIEANVELLSNMEEDILIALEIEDHPIQEKGDLQDIAWICKKITEERLGFASSLNVNLSFYLSKEDASESARFSLINTGVPPESLPISDYTIIIDKKWLEIAIIKLLDIAILLAMGEDKREVQISVSKSDETTLRLIITASAPLLSQTYQEQLFVEYYSELGTKTNLKSGSGLEGFIAKTISNQLDIPLEVKSWGNPPRIQLTLIFSKLPR